MRLSRKNCRRKSFHPDKLVGRGKLESGRWSHTYERELPWNWGLVSIIWISSLIFCERLNSPTMAVEIVAEVVKFFFACTPMFCWKILATEVGLSEDTVREWKSSDESRKSHIFCEFWWDIMIVDGCIDNTKKKEVGGGLHDQYISCWSSHSSWKVANRRVYKPLTMKVTRMASNFMYPVLALLASFVFLAQRSDVLSSNDKHDAKPKQRPPLRILVSGFVHSLGWIYP